mgnify:FL=1
MKVGKFYLSSDFIREHSNLVAKALSEIQFIPLQVEYKFYRNEFLMEGISEKFKDLDVGQAPPFYEVVINASFSGEREGDILVIIY